MIDKKKTIDLIKKIVTIAALSAFFSYCVNGSCCFFFILIPLCVGLMFLLRNVRQSPRIKLVFLLFLGAFLFRTSIVWLLNEFPLEDCDQVILTMQMPINGFVLPFLFDYCFDVFLPGIVFTLFSISIFCKCHRHLFVRGYLVIFLVILLWNALTIWLKIPLEPYLSAMTNTQSSLLLVNSDFWKENYSNIDSLKVESLGQEKNLILIIMESMENWPDSLVPEMRRLSEENISFSSTGVWGGGLDVAGSKNTYCSTISKTMGVPMLEFSWYRDGEYLVRGKSIYEILHQSKYRNVFLQGTDANFADFKSYLLNHGIDKLYDINNLRDKWDMSEVFRNIRSFTAGITDRKLYEISKEVLDTLKRGKFTLTMATIETHSPYGFYDSQCKEKPKSQDEESKFEATLRCASRQVYEYIEWVKKQEFYNNTEIVVVGDHLFMGNYFVENRNREWVAIFINSSKDSVITKRRFVSLDIAPTIIESMGFQIEGHKMGFGTSLFSDSLTLVEKMGKEKLNIELKKLSRSIEYNQLHLPYKK